MNIQVTQDVITLSGTLTHNCWTVLHEKCRQVLRQRRRVTICCSGLVIPSDDGMQTLVEAYTFALYNDQPVDITGLDPTTESHIFERINEQDVPDPTPLPRAG